MAVPRYDEFMPSIIRCLGDGETHSLKELTDYCAAEFRLSDSDRADTISSGQNKLINRVGWAKSYLKKAGLIDVDPKPTNLQLEPEQRHEHHKHYYEYKQSGARHINCTRHFHNVPPN